MKETIEKTKEMISVIIKSKDPFVRKAIAELGYSLDILINDEHWMVRRAVAEHGYGLDILINDKDQRVRETVIVVNLNNHNN